MKNLIPIFSLLFLIIFYGCKTENQNSGNVETAQQIDKNETKHVMAPKSLDLGNAYYNQKLNFVSTVAAKSAPTLDELRQSIFYIAEALNSGSKSINNQAKSYLTNFPFLAKISNQDPDFLIRPYYSFLNDVSLAQLTNVGNHHTNGTTDYYFQPFIDDPITNTFYSVAQNGTLQIADISSTSVTDLVHPIPLYIDNASTPSILMILEDSWDHFYTGQTSNHSHSTPNSISNKLNPAQLTSFNTIVSRSLSEDEDHKRGSYHFHDPCRVAYSQSTTLSFTFANKEILIRDNSSILYEKTVPLVVQPSDCAKFAGTGYEYLPIDTEMKVKIVAFTMFQEDGNGIKLMPVEYFAYYPDVI